MTARTPKSKTAGDKPWLEHYPAGARDLEIPRISLHVALDRAAEKFAGRTAMKFYGKNVTYAELSKASNNLAGALKRRGVGQGERVALYLLNSPQFVIAYLAVLKAGGVVVGVNPDLGAPELARFLAASGARYLFCHDLLYDNVVSSGVRDSRRSSSRASPTIYRLTNGCLEPLRHYLNRARRFTCLKTC